MSGYMDLGLLHRLPESELSRREFAAGWRFRYAVIVNGTFDDGSRLQVCKSSQLVLAEAMLTEALHDAAHFGSGR